MTPDRCDRAGVISELRKKPHNQDPKVCAWSQTHPASAFYLATLTIMEIERGTLIEESMNSPQGSILRTWFNALRIAHAGRVLPFNEGAAIRAAQLAGVNRPSVDLMIAAIALEFGHAVATRNLAHFNFAGLAVVDPWACSRTYGSNRHADLHPVGQTASDLDSVSVLDGLARNTSVAQLCGR